MTEVTASSLEINSLLTHFCRAEKLFGVHDKAYPLRILARIPVGECRLSDLAEGQRTCVGWHVWKCACNSDLCCMVLAAAIVWLFGAQPQCPCVTA